MTTFKRLEEIHAWQKARQATKRVYEISTNNVFPRDFGLRDQIRRSAVSVMANIAEGYGRRTNKDFANFLVLSHGSAAEVQSHLYIALDLEYIERIEFDELYRIFDEVSRMTMSLCQHLRTSR
jgi:four helix bundle protein